MEIETRNASIDTMEVTIRALHVSGRMMTLSVFRQLPVREIYLPDGSLDEMDLWGIVRYDIKEQGSLWVITSKGGILYRCDAGHKHLGVDGAEFYLQRSQDELAGFKQSKTDHAQYEIKCQEYTRVEKELQETNPFKIPSKFDWQNKECSLIASNNQKWMKEHLPERPEMPPFFFSHNRDIKTIKDFEEAVEWAESDLVCAINAAKARGIIMALPQLFLAV